MVQKDRFMLKRILISLSIVIANVCCAAEQSVYVPHFVEQIIIKDALIRPPYPPLMKWLISRYWKVTPDRPHNIVVRHADYHGLGDNSVIRSAAITPDGSKVITGSDKGTVKIWNLADGSLITQLNLFAISEIDNIEISPDGSRFVTVAWNNAAIWSIDGQLIAPLAATTASQFASIRISSDGSTCAAGFEHGIVKIWNMLNGALINTLNIKSDETIYEISPDLSKVCTQRENKYIDIWNLPEGTLFRTIHDLNCSRKISPDGSKIVTGSCDSSKVRNIYNGELIATLPAEPGVAQIRAITPDGYIGLESGGAHVNWGKARDSVKIWDMHSWEVLATLFDKETETKDATYSIAIGPHCLQVVTGHADGTFRIWTITPPSLVDALATISLEQLWLLEGIFEQAIKAKKADLSALNKPEIVNYIEQYGLLPNLIKDLVKDYVRFE